MNKYMKKIISIICVLFLLANIVCVTAFASETNSIVSGKVVNVDNENLMVSNIKIDIYALNEVTSDTDETNYDIEYEFYVTTDAQGDFSFEKPTPNCIVKIDCNTINDGYGALVEKAIVKSDETSVELSISILESYELDIESNELNFFNTNDEQLAVGDNVSAESLRELELRTIDEENVGISPCSDTDIMPLGSLPTFTNVATYTRGFFTYYYESGTLTSTELYQISTCFNNAKASYCSTYDFLTPNVPPGESTYPVYLLENIPGDTQGVLDAVELSWSFIEIEVGSGVTTNLVKVIYHEFMHAVQFTYRHFASDDYRAFSEGVSTMAGYLQTGLLAVSHVDKFQASPELNVFAYANNTAYKYREYGSMLFSQYIYDNYLELITIRQIYEEYSEVLNIYTAIDNVMREQYNSSLIELYLNFRVAAYDVYANYETELPTGINVPKKTAITEDVISYTTPYLSTMYFEQTDIEEDDYYTYYFVLEGDTTVSEANIKAIYTDPQGNVTVTNYDFTTKFKTIHLELEEGSTICFLMSNINITNKNIQFYTCI